MTEGRRAALAEAKALFRLAGPMVINMTAMVMLVTVDMAMVGRLGAAALGAVALANALSVMITVLGTVTLSPLTAMISRARGAGDEPELGRLFAAGVATALVMTVPMVALLLSSEWILPAVTALKLSHAGQVDPEVVSSAATYTRILAAGTPFGMAYTACVGSMRGLGRVKPGMVIAIVANAVNFAGDWALMFGHLGAPRLGLPGCALATSLTRVAMFACAIGYLRLDPELRQRLRPGALFKVHGARVKQLLKLGLPLGIHELLDRGVFAAATFLIAQLATVELAVNQLAFNLWATLISGIASLAVAGSIRIGTAVGAGDAGGARRTLRVALSLGGAAALLLASAAALFPSAVLRLYTDDASVIASGSAVIRWAALFLFVDALTSIALQALIAVLDTNKPSLMGVVLYWLLGLPLGCVFAFGFGLGAAGIWVGFCAADVVFLVYLLRRCATRLPAETAVPQGAAA